MIKRLLTSILALSLTTSSFFILSANADEKDEKAVDKDNIREIKIRANMPEEWLAEHDEFDITFEHDGEKSYVFFDKDNEFERWTELEKGVEYNVIFSDDFDGYEISGLGDTYTLTEDKATIVLEINKKGEEKSEDKSEEKSEEKTEDKKLDVEINDLVDNKRYLSPSLYKDYSEARVLVQDLIDTMNEIGMYDENNETWKSLNKDDKTAFENFIKGINIKDVLSDLYKNDDRITYIENDEFSSKDIFCYEWLKELLEYNLNKYDKEKFMEKQMYYWDCYTTKEGTPEHIINTGCKEKLFLINEWSYQKKVELGKTFDIYGVYLDIKYNIDYVEFNEPSEESETEEESSIVESSKTEESSAVIEDSVESASSPESSQSISSAAEKASNNEGVARNVAPEKTFGEKMKDNIVAIILGACLIAAIGIIIAMSRKNKKN